MKALQTTQDVELAEFLYKLSLTQGWTLLGNTIRCIVDDVKVFCPLEVVAKEWGGRKLNYLDAGAYLFPSSKVGANLGLKIARAADNRSLEETGVLEIREALLQATGLSKELKEAA